MDRQETGNEHDRGRGRGNLDPASRTSREGDGNALVEVEAQTPEDF